MKKDKGNQSVCLYVTVDGKKLVLGTLFSEKLPQQQFDLVFDKEFELSHNWKNGSVYFYGYKANNPYEEYPLSCFPLKQYILIRHCMLCIIVWNFSPWLSSSFPPTVSQGDESGIMPLTITPFYQLILLVFPVYLQYLIIMFLHSLFRWIWWRGYPTRCCK